MLKTTNKKYYKRIDIPDMQRLGIELDEGDLAWKYQNSTVIISYDKPQKIIDAENKKKSELKTLGMTGSAPMSGGLGGSRPSDVRSLLGGPQPGAGGQDPQQCKQQ